MTSQTVKKSFFEWITERRNLGVWAVMFGWVFVIVQALDYVTINMGVTVTDELSGLLIVWLIAGMLIMGGVDYLSEKTTSIRRGE